MATTKPEPFLSLGFAAIDWIEHYLVHGPGDVQGQPIALDDEFAAFIVKAYRVDANGNRVVRRAFLSRAKGRSKSGLAAMVECFEALGPCRFDHFAEAGEVSAWGYEYEPGEPVGRPLVYVEILNVATEEGQAGNTYDAVYYMLNPETAAPELVRDYGRVDVGLARTTLPARRGFIEPITTRDDSKDGGKSTFIVADETHLWILPRLKRLHGVMTRNLLKRKAASGWMLETSTMYAEGRTPQEKSVAEGTHEYAKSVRAGKVGRRGKQDQTLLFDHVQASDKWDLTKRPQRMRALREAYGPAAAWMNLDAICDSWDDPQVSEAEFRRYWLNQPVPTDQRKFTIVTAQQWADSADVKSTITGSIALGLDVESDGLSAAIAASGKRTDGLRHGELTGAGGVLDVRPGTGWVVDRVVQVAEGCGPCVLVLDPGSPAGALVPELVSRGFVKVKSPDDKIPFGKWRLYLVGPREYAQACGGWAGDVRNDRYRHLDQQPFNDAVEGARTRPLADAYAWSRKDSTSVNISPLVASTHARHGHALFGEVDRPAPFMLVGR